MTQNSRALRSIIFMSAILGSVFHLTATTPILEWDANEDPYVAGYKVYRGGKSGAYDHVVDVGTETSIALTDLDPGLTYYFAITAYASDLAESDYSEEIFYTTPIDGITTIGKPCRLNTGAGIPTVSFYGNAGERYWIQASSDFNTWERVNSGQVAVDGLLEIADEPVVSRPMRFYRVVTSLH